MPSCTIELQFYTDQLKDIDGSTLYEGDINDSGDWKPTPKEAWSLVEGVFDPGSTVFVNPLGILTHFITESGNITALRQNVRLYKEIVPKIGH